MKASVNKGKVVIVTTCRKIYHLSLVVRSHEAYSDSVIAYVWIIDSLRIEDSSCIGLKSNQK